MRRYSFYIFLVTSISAYFAFFSPKFLNEDYKFKEFIFNTFGKRVVSLPFEQEIKVIDIDEASLKAYQTEYPINRKLLALILARLKDARQIILALPIQGASGAAGDHALIKVLKQQQNVIIPIKFTKIGANFGGIVNVEGISWLPWRKILPYVMVGGVDFYPSPTGNVEGFYPFFSYRGRIVPHLLSKELGLLEGFDENRFSYSARWNRIKWKFDQEEFVLPLDYFKGISIYPGLFSYLTKIKPYSIQDVLPPELYRRYARHGVGIPPTKSFSGEICIVGCTAGPESTFLSFKGHRWPLHHVLAAALISLKSKSFLYCPPLWIQVLLVVMLSFSLGFVLLFRPKWIISLLPLSLGVVLILWGYSLYYRVFWLGIEWMAVLLSTELVSASLGFRKELAHRQAKQLEKQVVKEIKEKTTYLPSHRDWIDMRVKEVVGEEVGSSVYDFIEINQDKIGLAISDVMDKGKEALTKASYLRGLLRSHSIITHQPGEVVYSINKALVKGMGINMSCKFLYALLDASRNRVVFSGAGGVSFIVLDRYRKQVKCYEVEERIPLGLSREIFYEPKDLAIHKGDVLIFYSPCIFNFRNPEGRSYDVDRLGRLILANARLSINGLLDKIVMDIKRFSGIREDFVLIAIEWRKDSIDSEDDHIYVGISPKEKNLLLFYKKIEQRRPLGHEG